MNNNVALITGINGQDGSYLSEFLLQKGYIIHGIIRTSSTINTIRIDHILKKIQLHYADISDISCMRNIFDLIYKKYPNLNQLEVYNLAAQSHVKVSFEIPIYTTNVDAIGVLNLLEVIRVSPIKDKIRLYQASSSEMFGKVLERPQSEKLHLILNHLMQLQNFMHIGLLKIIDNPIQYLHQMVFYSIMNQKEDLLILSQEKSLWD